jgi:hypothetical protein
MNHIAENITFKKKNISFLAINALFRQKEMEIEKAALPFVGSYFIKGFVPLQKNDRLRTKPEEMTVVFRLDKHQNIIVITAYSQSDEE